MPTSAKRITSLRLTLRRSAISDLLNDRIRDFNAAKVVISYAIAGRFAQSPPIETTHVAPGMPQATRSSTKELREGQDCCRAGRPGCSQYHKQTTKKNTNY